MTLTEISNLYYQLAENFAKENNLRILKQINAKVKLINENNVYYLNSNVFDSFQDENFGKFSIFKYRIEEHHEKFLKQLMLLLSQEDRIKLVSHWNLVQTGTIQEYHRFIRSLKKDIGEENSIELFDNLSTKCYQSGGSMNMDRVAEEIKKTVGEEHFHISFLNFMASRYKKQNNTEEGIIKFRDCLIKEFGHSLDQLKEYLPYCPLLKNHAYFKENLNLFLSEEEKRFNVVERINLDVIKSYLSLKDWSNREYFIFFNGFIAENKRKYNHLNFIEIKEMSIQENETHMVFYIRNESKDEIYIEEFKNDMRQLCEIMRKHSHQFKSAYYNQNKEFVDQAFYIANLKKELELSQHSNHYQRKI